MRIRILSSDASRSCPYKTHGINQWRQVLTGDRQALHEFPELFAGISLSGLSVPGPQPVKTAIMWNRAGRPGFLCEAISFPGLDARTGRTHHDPVPHL